MYQTLYPKDSQIFNHLEQLNLLNNDYYHLDNYQTQQQPTQVLRISKLSKIINYVRKTRHLINNQILKIKQNLRQQIIILRFISISFSIILLYNFEIVVSIILHLLLYEISDRFKIQLYYYTPKIQINKIYDEIDKFISIVATGIVMEKNLRNQFNFQTNQHINESLTYSYEYLLIDQFSQQISSKITIIIFNLIKILSQIEYCFTCEQLIEIFDKKDNMEKAYLIKSQFNQIMYSVNINDNYNQPFLYFFYFESKKQYILDDFYEQLLKNGQQAQNYIDYTRFIFENLNQQSQITNNSYKTTLIQQIKTLILNQTVLIRIIELGSYDVSEKLKNQNSLIYAFTDNLVSLIEKKIKLPQNNSEQSEYIGCNVNDDKGDEPELKINNSQYVVFKEYLSDDDSDEDRDMDRTFNKLKSNLEKQMMKELKESVNSKQKEYKYEIKGERKKIEKIPRINDMSMIKKLNTGNLFQELKNRIFETPETFQ